MDILMTIGLPVVIALVALIVVLLVIKSCWKKIGLSLRPSISLMDMRSLLKE